MPKPSVRLRHVRVPLPNSSLTVVLTVSPLGVLYRLPRARGGVYTPLGADIRSGVYVSRRMGFKLLRGQQPMPFLGLSPLSLRVLQKGVA